ncbi:membrane protein [Planomonospora parontospora subsp. parontospora]|uniref:Membrane protein n=2 Tax=Planomonospora parontospora TaxID=58119 RepID=A0AA37F332_9ACTN|nr:DUF4395 domain-containing protein [Planomonospora parontospora]GGK53870.1 membrane protein [Planomonospora parontospora]GII07582.1 membrane protein [Planomonospora parontospora subsp. parontospora]
MQADPRALRFAATATAVVLALVLVTDSVWLLAAQTAVFALGAVGASPYGMVFKGIVKSPPRDLEDARPPRFAQRVGLAFALAALVGHATQIAPLALGATAAALFAAFLNAAFGFCLGCETYLIIRRLLPAAR